MRRLESGLAPPPRTGFPPRICQRRLGLGPDADVLLVVQVGERVRQVGGRRVVRLLGEESGEFDEGCAAEGLPFAERGLDRGLGEGLPEGGTRHQRTRERSRSGNEAPPVEARLADGKGRGKCPGHRRDTRLSTLNST